MNDDDSLRPTNLSDEDENLTDLGEIDSDEDILGDGKKKPKKTADEDDSLDDLAEGEDGTLPEDSFDDVEPEDRW